MKTVKHILNEGFDRLFETKKVIKESAPDAPLTEKQKQIARELLRTVNALARQRGAGIKEAEVALQDVIERYFPNHEWWEVCDCDIFTELRNDAHYAPINIVKSIRQEFLGEEKEYGFEDCDDEECNESANNGLTRSEESRFVSALYSALQKEPYGYSAEEAHEIAVKRAEDLDPSWRVRWNNNLNAQIRQELKYTVTKAEYDAELGEGKCNESVGDRVAEYQKWVDYDMKKYGKISGKTMGILKREGFTVVKDEYGDLEVIPEEKDHSSIKESKESDVKGWWNEVEKWNAENGNKYTIDNEGADVGDMLVAMWDMLMELKTESPKLYRKGKRIFNKYSDFTQITESMESDVKSWWDEVEKWNTDNGNKYNIDNEGATPEEMRVAMWDMLAELKGVAPELYKKGKKIYNKHSQFTELTEGKRSNKRTFRYDVGDNKYSFYCETEDTRYGFRHLCSMFLRGQEVGDSVKKYYNRTWEMFDYQSAMLSAVENASISAEDKKSLKAQINEGEGLREGKQCEGVDDDGISDEEYYAELEKHIAEIPSYDDEKLKAEYKEFKDSTHEDDIRVETALKDEMVKRGFLFVYEGMKVLNENAPNFAVQDGLPIYAFLNYEEEQDYMWDRAKEEYEGEVNDDGWDEFLEDFEEKYWDEYFKGYAVIDPENDEFDGKTLNDAIKDFNDMLKGLANKAYDASADAWREYENARDSEDVSDEDVNKLEDEANELDGIYSYLRDLELSIQSGYHQGYQLYLDGWDDIPDDFPQEYTDAIIDAYNKVGKDFHLMKLGLAWQASNGEAGYSLIED